MGLRPFRIGSRSLSSCASSIGQIKGDPSRVGDLDHSIATTWPGGGASRFRVLAAAIPSLEQARGPPCLARTRARAGAMDRGRGLKRKPPACRGRRARAGHQQKSSTQKGGRDVSIRRSLRMSSHDQQIPSWDLPHSDKTSLSVETTLNVGTRGYPRMSHTSMTIPVPAKPMDRGQYREADHYHSP